jgi:hypothetical protein
LAISEFQDYVGKTVFLQSKGTLKIMKLGSFEIGAYNQKQKMIEMKATLESDDGTIKEIRTPNLLIRPNHFAIQLHKDADLFAYEQKIIEFLISNKIITTLFLKKPVNNEETGYLTKIIPNYTLDEENKQTSDKGARNHSNSEKKIINKDWNLESAVELSNLHGKNMILQYKQIEFVSFEYDSLLFVDLSEISFSTKMGYIISKKMDPSKFFL